VRSGTLTSFAYSPQEESFVPRTVIDALSDKGKILGHVGTVEDITECKQAEEERGRFIREQEARQQAEADRMRMSS